MVSTKLCTQKSEFFTFMYFLHTFTYLAFGHAFVVNGRLIYQLLRLMSNSCQI